MNKKTRLSTLLAAVPLAGISLFASAAGPIAIADIGLDSVIAGSGPAAGGAGVNVRLLDLSFTAGTGFNNVRNWMEVQISTTPTLQPTPFTAQEREDFHLGGYPGLAQVEGHGKLSAGEYATAVYLNINESAISGFDFGKLSLVWAGDKQFPIPGAKPTSMVIARDGFSLGAPGGAFDVMVAFGAGALGPDGNISTKLAFVYDDGNTDIGLDLFQASSVGGGSPYLAAATVWGTPGVVGFIGGTEAVVSSIAEVPEPETYAMLALGLLGVGFAVRRQARS